VVVNADRHALELVGVLDAEDGAQYADMAAPEEYSTSRPDPQGETIVVHDAERELDPERARRSADPRAGAAVPS